MAVGVILSSVVLHASARARALSLFIRDRPRPFCIAERLPMGTAAQWLHSSTDARDRDVCRFNEKWHYWVGVCCEDKVPFVTKNYRYRFAIPVSVVKLFNPGASILPFISKQQRTLGPIPVLNS